MFGIGSSAPLIVLLVADTVRGFGEEERKLQIGPVIPHIRDLLERQKAADSKP